MANEDDPFDTFSTDFTKFDSERMAARGELVAINVRIDALEVKLKDAVERRRQILEKKNLVESQLNELAQRFSSSYAQPTPADSLKDDIKMVFEQEPTARPNDQLDYDALSDNDIITPTQPQSRSVAESQSRSDSAGSTTTEDEARYQYEPINSKYGNIVSIDGDVYAISCFVCKANSSMRLHLFRGINGLKIHIRQVHDTPDLPYDKVARRYIKVKLDAEEIRLVKEGCPPKQLVEPVHHSAEVTRDPVVPKSEPDAPSINAKYRHVVLIEGQWIELSCSLCGANYSPRNNKYFNGVRGLNAHLTSSMHALRVKVEDTLDHCTKRVVSDRDVETVPQGKSRKPVDCVIRKRRHQDESDSEQSNVSAGPSMPHDRIGRSGGDGSSGRLSERCGSDGLPRPSAPDERRRKGKALMTNEDLDFAGNDGQSIPRWTTPLLSD